MTWLHLSNSEFALLVAIVTVAGIVRGFSGFALSALVMAAATLILPPVELIPLCWWLEMTASALMVRGGWKEADRRVVWGLVIGSTCGVPLGLWLTTSVPADTSKLIALCVIIALALTQLLKVRLAVLATRAGLYLSGLVAGIVTGLAHVGGMVVALYVLAQDSPAAKMRAALVMFLFLSSLTSMVTQLLFGVMTQTAALRGLALALPCAAGVWIGTRFFTDRWAGYYKPFCLTLLIGLALLSLLREVLS